jgi:hypothetical protein
VAFRKLEDAPEDPVGWSVGAGFFPPAFDDSSIVPENLEMLAFA